LIHQTKDSFSGAGVSTEGLWHYPATITNSTIATEIATFDPAGSFTSKSTAAVINTFGNRTQMVWFTSWATEWSQSSNFLQHAHIHYLTRGLCKLNIEKWTLFSSASLTIFPLDAGFRRTYFGAQVDDVHLSTDLYQPANTTWRLRASDLVAHASWQTALSSRLPAGSSIRLELGHNGNGNIEYATNNDPTGKCSPENAIELDAPYSETTLEFQKPLGSGTSVWPSTPATYKWTKACTALDPLTAWFEVTANRDNYFHVSHTFTHEALNNATNYDANKEITFNVAWLKQVGISAGKFSSKSLIPPAITGLHNGDVINAWMANGIIYAVGDNSRPVLSNTVCPKS
jgi:hypothetical protein